MRLEFTNVLAQSLRDKDIYLWDVGKCALWTFFWMAERQVNVRAFVTNYSEYYGQSIMNRPIISVDEFSEKPNAVMITSDVVSDGTFELASSYGTCYRWSDALEINPKLQEASQAGTLCAYGNNEKAWEFIEYLRSNDLHIPAFAVYEEGPHRPILGVPVVTLGAEDESDTSVKADTSLLLYEKNPSDEQGILDRLERKGFSGTVYLRDLVMFWDIWATDPYIMLDSAMKQRKRILFCCEERSASELFHRIFSLYDVPIAREVSFEGRPEDGLEDIWALADENPASSVVLCQAYSVYRRLEIVEAINDLGFSLGDHNYAATHNACHNRMRVTRTLEYIPDEKLGASIDYTPVGGRPGWAVFGDEAATDVRIMVLGGSTSSEVYYPESWVSKLHHKLTERGIQAVIFNGAHETNRTFHELNRLVRDIHALKPTIVISMSGYNDLAANITFFETNRESNSFEYWRRMESYMKLIAEAEGAEFHAFLQPINQAPVEMDLFETMMYLKEVHHRARVFSENCRDDDFYHNLMRTFLHRNELYIDMCHYSEKGNDELAELVLEAITKGHRS